MEGAQPTVELGAIPADGRLFCCPVQTQPGRRGCSGQGPVSLRKEVVICAIRRPDLLSKSDEGSQ